MAEAKFMQDRIAEAIARAAVAGEDFGGQARAALQAMREPTEAMVTALLGAESELGRFGYGHDSQFADRKQFDDGWHAMIDEALK
jgi:hypothetical protein